MSLLPRWALASSAVLATLAVAAAPAGAAPSPPPLSAQPSTVDFGVQPVDWGGQSRSVWLQNTGPDPLTLGSSWLDGSAAFRVGWDGCAGMTLNPGDGCTVTPEFDPDDGAEHEGDLHVPVTGFDDRVVALSGTGGVQQVEIEPGALEFGSVAVGESATRAFTLASTGTLPFQSFVAMPAGGDVGAFRVMHDGCSLQPPSGAPCTVVVRFAPLEPGVASAVLLLIGGESEPAIVPLRGTGAAPAPAPPAGPAAPAVAPPPAAAPAGAPRSARKRRPSVDVRLATAAGELTAYSRGRIALGRARCAGARRCTVVVRTRVFAVAGDGRAHAASARAQMTSVRGDALLWRLRGKGRPVRIALPLGLRGRPALLVARLRVRAPDRRATVRTLVVPLAPR